MELLSKPLNAISMAHWNVAPTLMSPKGIYHKHRFPIWFEMLFSNDLLLKPKLGCIQKIHLVMITLRIWTHFGGFAPWKEQGNYLLDSLDSSL